MSDARTVIARKKCYAQGTVGEEWADGLLAALALAGFVITTRERWDALVRVAEGIERVVASKALEGSE